ncbi:MAG: hypothetical protein EOM76_04645 [Sphingobacteriia bacterium]|jgi:hypothetical protein|nr:FtsL-like putative cell division protein [Paludibacteraceae bacterium]NCA79462.1 hypothetical protein [Sphingobacteriia bacterium]
MTLFKNIRAKLDAKIQKKQDRPKFNIRHLIGGDVLTRQEVQRQIPFIIFIAILCLFYIHNRFVCEQDLVTLDKLKKELIEVKCESLSKSETLVQMNRRSYLIDKLKENNSPLQESLEPVIVIKK